MKEYICRTCGKECNDWGELADHINSTKDKTHNKDRAGKKWAKLYIHRNAVNKLKNVGRDYEPRIALTPEQRMAKEDTRMILSGERVIAPVKCPRCKRGSRQLLEIEFINEPQVWKIDGCFAILCEVCR